MNKPWIKQPPPPVRVISIRDQSDWNSWNSNRQNGDEVTVIDCEITTGLVDIRNQYLVIKGLDHARVNGSFDMQAPNQWIAGLHIFANQLHNIQMFWPNNYVINNVIDADPDPQPYVGIFSGASGEHVIYGNVVRNKKYALYMQSPPTNMDYVGENYLGDVTESNNKYAIHHYTQTAYRGDSVQYFRNVSANGAVLIGGENLATEPCFNSFAEHWFYHSDVRGYKRAHLTDFIDCHFLHSELGYDFMHGDVASTMPAEEQALVIGNDFYNPNGYTHRLSTADESRGIVVGEAPIQKTANWNHNRYHGFKGKLHANGSLTDPINTIEEWQLNTGYAGKEFDTNSVVVDTPPSNQYWLLPNDYDTERALLVVWNSGRPKAVKVTLPRYGYLSSVKDPYVVAKEGRRDISIYDQELSVWIVRY